MARLRVRHPPDRVWEMLFDRNGPERDKLGEPRQSDRIRRGSFGKDRRPQGSRGKPHDAVPRSRMPRRDIEDPETVFGALDLGTNNCRLLIAVPTPNGPRVIDAFSRIVRLGEGLGVYGTLKPEAMNRTIEALRICANKLVWHRVAKKRLIATEACRTATNGAEFIQRVKEEIGLELEIIDRETEARLAAAGAAPLIDRDTQSAVVFDIGGGSTEVLWMEAEGSRFAIKAWTSLAAGVVTLSERTGGGAHVTEESFAKMRAQVAELLQPFIAEVKRQRSGDTTPGHLLGTSGTVTTIAGVQMGLRSYDRTRVDGAWLVSDQVGHVVQQLLDMDYEQRIRNGCIGRERADLVLAGCAILEEIRLAFPAQRIRVADRGLREGILADLMMQEIAP
jgi:exopolyphosphatase / guanosine-5'-triphosphate,3'-diphosphate pyrophosphatase